MKLHLLLILASLAMAVDDPEYLNHGYKEIAWGSDKQLLVAKYPKPLGLIRTKDGMGVYIIDARRAFFVKGDKVVGIRFGDIIDSEVLIGIGLSRMYQETEQVYGDLALGSTWAEVKKLLKIGDDVKADYRVQVVRGGVKWQMAFSSYSGMDGDSKYRLHGLTILSDDGVPGEGGIDASNAKSLF